MIIKIELSITAPGRWLAGVFVSMWPVAALTIRSPKRIVMPVIIDSFAISADSQLGLSQDKPVQLQHAMVMIRFSLAA